MTILTMVWALKHAAVPANDPVAHLVLIAYADHAKDDGTAAWPSVATVARYARCTPRTVYTKRRLLVEHGLMRPGDQQLVAHLPPNRRPIVYDLVIDPAAADCVTTTDTDEDEAAGQAGVKMLHPQTGDIAARDAVKRSSGMKPASPQSTESVDNQGSGVNEASPHPVDNPEPGVKAASPQTSSWGERQRTPGVNVSSYKPPLEPPTTNHGSPQSGTSPAAIHSPEPPRLPDRCQAHQHLRVPVPCQDCRTARLTTDAATAPPSSGQTSTDGLPDGGVCEHGGAGGSLADGSPRCPACRRGLTGGTAPWDAQPPARLRQPGAA